MKKKEIYSNEIKSYIVRKVMTMSEVVALGLHWIMKSSDKNTGR